MEEFVAEADVLGEESIKVRVNPFQRFASGLAIGLFNLVQQVGTELLDSAKEGEVGELHLLGERALDVAGEEVADIIHRSWRGG